MLVVVFAQGLDPVPVLIMALDLLQVIQLGCSVISVAFYYLCGYFSLVMPYWLFYVSHVEDRFFNTIRL
jgi:hypothetical protein